VRHVLRTHAGGAVAPEDLADAVQDALLWAWERRHCPHITDFPAYMSTVIRQKLRQRYAGHA
jgi:DNA-directed RNA polymerase specialized sigma24 family protein